LVCETEVAVNESFASLKSFVVCDDDVCVRSSKLFDFDALFYSFYVKSVFLYVILINWMFSEASTICSYKKNINK
jgi:hypothetical protein